MRKIRVALMPLLVLALLAALSLWNINFDKIARFHFLWDTLLGIGLGAGLCWLPALTGTKQKKQAHGSLYWVGAFGMLLLLCLQYMALLTGTALFAWDFLLLANGRSCVVEGAGLGYCVTQALRNQ